MTTSKEASDTGIPASDAKLYDKCAACASGFYVIYDSRALVAVGIRVAYLHCNKCDHKPERNRVEFPLSERPKRPKL